MIKKILLFYIVKSKKNTGRVKLTDAQSILLDHNV